MTIDPTTISDEAADAAVESYCASGDFSAREAMRAAIAAAIPHLPRTNEPRIISADEIRKGDRIRVQFSAGGLIITREGVADHRDTRAWLTAESFYFYTDEGNATIWLLDRPEDPRIKTVCEHLWLAFRLSDTRSWADVPAEKRKDWEAYARDLLALLDAAKAGE